MKAEVYRDNAGFWMARIEEDASTPENRGIGRVYRRQMLPVAPSASKAEAEAALLRVSTKYLIEKQRYEGTTKLVGVPFVDDQGNEHTYGINNSDSSLLARWLLERNPKLRIELRTSMFDKEKKDEA
jgi:hypothetical protein